MTVLLRGNEASQANFFLSCYQREEIWYLPASEDWRGWRLVQRARWCIVLSYI